MSKLAPMPCLSQRKQGAFDWRDSSTEIHVLRNWSSLRGKSRCCYQKGELAFSFMSLSEVLEGHWLVVSSWANLPWPVAGFDLISLLPSLGTHLSVGSLIPHLPQFLSTPWLLPPSPRIKGSILVQLWYSEAKLPSHPPRPPTRPLFRFFSHHYLPLVSSQIEHTFVTNVGSSPLSAQTLQMVPNKLRIKRQGLTMAHFPSWLHPCLNPLTHLTADLCTFYASRTFPSVWVALPPGASSCLALAFSTLVRGHDPGEAFLYFAAACSHSVTSDSLQTHGL